MSSEKRLDPGMVALRVVALVMVRVVLAVLAADQEVEVNRGSGSGTIQCAYGLATLVQVRHVSRRI